MAPSNALSRVHHLFWWIACPSKLFEHVRVTVVWQFVQPCSVSWSSISREAAGLFAPLLDHSYVLFHDKTVIKFDSRTVMLCGMRAGRGRMQVRGDTIRAGRQRPPQMKCSAALPIIGSLRHLCPPFSIGKLGQLQSYTRTILQHHFVHD